MNKIRFGVLSTAKIAMEKVIPAMQRSEHVEVTAIASRDESRACDAAARLGIRQAFGSYEALLADPAIEAVYNPLPNHLHVPWSIAAIEAGKHVLCEKPIGLSADEGQKLVDAARARPGLKVMEAFMYRHHPQWQRAKRIVDEGGIGTLATIQTFFSYFNDDPHNIRNQPEIGGGALADIGCYAISLSRFIFAAEPRRVLGTVEYDPRFRTDRLASAILEFAAGTSTFTCGTQLVPFQRVNIFGDQGRVEIDIPFNAPPDRPCTMRLQRGSEIEEISLPVCDQYTLQADLFAEAIRHDRDVPTPIEDAVANMRVIEAVIESSQRGVWGS
ncbi:MAG TPA: Gfo/Idh/MocA family oxidoreductase [Pirellulales bacterium]|jgi:predicted dehydrogenase|nr:Gfo/Idh/MocA family oxidoreductase [Pirellulales bacterium]